MDTTVDIPALTRAGMLAPASIDAKTRSVEVIWTTGARVRRASLFEDAYDEELSLDPAHVRLERLNAGAPFLKVHDAGDLEAVIGSVVPGSARIEAGQGVARIRLSERAGVEDIWRDIEAGHIRAVSIGYQVHRYEIEKAATGPELWRAVDWTPFEISAVPVGADAGARMRHQPPRSPCVLTRSHPEPQTRTDPMAENDDARAEEDAGADSTKDEDSVTTDPQKPGADARDQTRSSDPAPQTRSVDTDTLVREARAQERERVSTIHSLAERLNLGRSFADDLVTRGVSLDEARAAALDRIAERADRTPTFGSVSIPLGGQDATVTRREAVANALLHRYSPGEFALEDAAREYRGLSLLELARESLDVAGESTRGLSRDQVATRALHSTSDFPEILGNVTRRTLRASYEAYPNTFRRFCRRVTATDFKEMHRVQMGEAPQLVKVNEAGEFKRGALSESKESYRIDTFGRVLAITRQVIVNDDLDAFTRIPAMWGTSIAQLEGDVVWAVITANAAMADGKALFHADHRNLAGTGAALGAESIGAGRTAMRKQTGLDKKVVLNLTPAFLLVPAALEFRAEQIFADTIVPVEDGKAIPRSIRTLEPIVEPRLDTASETAWYLAASSSQVDTIEYAYLEGQENAFIETRNGFDVDGIEIKCRLDFGAKAIDWRGLYKNSGA